MRICKNLTYSSRWHPVTSFKFTRITRHRIYTDGIIFKKRWWVICRMISYDHWKIYDWIRQTNELAMKSSNPKKRSSFRFLDICCRITYKGKTYQLKYFYFASISNFIRRSRNIVRREDYLRYFSKDSVVQTNSIKRYRNIFAFLKWNRRYF